MKHDKKIDPREKFVKPPFPKQSQVFPGLESKMNPLPNWGKETYKGNGQLTGKVALVTGGDSGIGRAVAYAYACEGASVAISYLNETSDAMEVAAAIESKGGKVLLLEGDISQEEKCLDLVERTISTFGSINILVNNAAFQMNHGGIADISTEEFDQTFKTNIYAPFYLSKAVLPYMQPGDSIINTASIQAYDPSPSLLAYASTKGALVTFTKALAKELIHKGIRVNAVAPGPVWTPFIPASAHPTKSSTFGEQSYLKRPAQPIEISPIFVFLASDSASYVMGEIWGTTGEVGVA